MVSRHEPSPVPTLGCLCSVFWPGGFWSIFVSKCSHRVTANSGAEDLEEQKRSTWSGLCGSPARDSCFKWCYSGCFHWFHCIFPVFPHSQHLTSSCETCWHNALWKHCACSPGVKMLVSKAILLDLIGNPQIQTIELRFTSLQAAPFYWSLKTLLQKWQEQCKVWCQSAGYQMNTERCRYQNQVGKNH